MPRSGTERKCFKTDSGKRKRDKQPVKKSRRASKHGFREGMIRTLDELELGGFLPSCKEVKDLINDSNKTTDCCLQKGVIDCPKTCPRCSHPVKMNEGHTVRCRRPDCAYTPPTKCQRCTANVSVTKKDGDDIVESNCKTCEWQWRPGVEFENSMFRGSIFQSCKLPKNEVFHCLWLWMNKIPSSTAAHMLAWQEDTAGKWHRHFRQTASQMINNHIVGEGVQIGGLDANGDPIVVEIDESKFGKRKCNRGCRVRANWVIGMVERTEQRRCVMVVVEKRDQSVCTAVVKKHVKPGSMIFSDKWPGCNPIKKIPDKGHDHRTLCHKDDFTKLEEDGSLTHTQTIEGTWGAQKKAIPVHKRNGAELQDCLDEFMWRRANAGDLWSAMVKAFSTVRCAAPETLRVNAVEEPWVQTDVLINADECVDFYSDDTDAEDEGVVLPGATAAVSRSSGRRNFGRRGPTALVPDLSRSAAVDDDQQDDINRALGNDGTAANAADGVRGVIQSEPRLVLLENFCMQHLHLAKSCQWSILLTSYVMN